MTVINQHHMQTPVKLPTIYELETPGPLLVFCVACRSRAFRQDDTLACIACGREIAEVRERRPAPIDYAALREDQRGKPGRPPGSRNAKPAPTGNACSVCGAATSGRNATGRCFACAMAALIERARLHRNPCEDCGDPSDHPRSSRFCRTHIDKHYDARRVRPRQPCLGGCGKLVRADSKNHRCLVCFNRWSNKRRKGAAA